jgi:hypothetical protein
MDESKSDPNFPHIYSLDIVINENQYEKGISNFNQHKEKITQIKLSY